VTNTVTGKVAVGFKTFIPIKMRIGGFSYILTVFRKSGTMESKFLAGVQSK
jgi:hypothetical protein